MRWSDLPPDRGAADAAASGLRRAEWERLRQRLERLPAGHPSSPGDDGPQAEEPDDDLEAGADGDPETGQATSSDAHDRDQGRPADPEHGRPGGSAGGASRPAGDSQLGTPRGGEPYRPWFASGEQAEPWFAPGGQ